MKTSAAFCRVSATRHRVASPLLTLLLGLVLSPFAHGQQWRVAEIGQDHARGQAILPAMNEPVDNSDLQQRRAELRRERKMQWLKSANGSVGGAASGQGESGELQEPPVARGLMGGMSREERHRLRTDIREAGFSAYSAAGTRRRP